MAAGDSARQHGRRRHRLTDPRRHLESRPGLSRLRRRALRWLQSSVCSVSSVPLRASTRAFWFCELVCRCFGFLLPASSCEPSLRRQIESFLSASPLLHPQPNIRYGNIMAESKGALIAKTVQKHAGRAKEKVSARCVYLPLFFFNRSLFSNTRESPSSQSEINTRICRLFAWSELIITSLTCFSTTWYSANFANVGGVNVSRHHRVTIASCLAIKSLRLLN